MSFLSFDTYAHLLFWAGAIYLIVPPAGFVRSLWGRTDRATWPDVLLEVIKKLSPAALTGVILMAGGVWLHLQLRDCPTPESEPAQAAAIVVPTEGS